jgi:hypothetical protein
VDAAGALREVASWLILDCPRCRRQSDVTFRLDAQMLFHARLETARR